MCPREANEQAGIVQWAKLATLPRRPPERLIQYLLHVTNEGKRRTGGFAVGQGLSAGYPDLALEIPSRGHHGLRCEVKRRPAYYGTEQAMKAAVSDAQRDWLRRLWGQGYFAFVGFGMNQAIDVMSWYVGLTESAPTGVLTGDRI